MDDYRFESAAVILARIYAALTLFHKTAAVAISGAIFFYQVFGTWQTFVLKMPRCAV
jgi:hypothetical protein